MELPKSKTTIKKKPVTFEVELNLLNEVKKHAKLKKLTMRQVIEYGFQTFLEKIKLP